MRLLALAVVGLLGCGRLGFDEVGLADPGTGPDGGADNDGGAFAQDGAALETNDAGPLGTPLANCADNGCRQLIVDGTTFLRDNNVWFPATVSPFVLDRYEVTVSRFREFVASGSGTQSTAPDDGDGAHPAIANSGWRSSWSSILPASTSDLVTRVSSVTNATYTTSVGAREQFPIVGISWYEAFAFCVWDGGRLPTVAEHEAAAFGGAEQRPYPWGASYDATKVAIGSIARIGSHSPTGDARWGHSDLVGNADEWALDYFGALPQPCGDCAQLTPESTPTRVQLGGSFQSNVTDYEQTGLLHGMGPAQRNGLTGFRCARER